MVDSAARVMHFGIFEVDLESGELRKAGRRVALQEQPFRILVRLLGEPGRVVTREELRQELWPADTFVDFEQGLNAAVRRLREALGDTADHPRYIETLPRRGYRFVAPVESMAAESPPAKARRRRRFAEHVVPAAAIAVLVAAPAVTYLVRSTGSESSPTSSSARFVLQPPSGVRVARSGAGTVLAMSPDGQWVAFGGIGNDESPGGLYVRSLGEIEARLVARAGVAPFFSPDSRWLAYIDRGVMQKVPVGGGHPERICDAPQLRGASWGDDGQIIFSTGEELLRVPANGGVPGPLTRAPDGERHYWPHVLPGSRAALFTRHRGVNDSFRYIAVVSLLTGEIRSFSALSGSHPRFAPTGHLVYGRGGTLYAVAFDARRLEPVGEPRVMFDDVHFYYGSGYTAFDVSAAGALAYLSGATHVEDAELVWLDREGHVVSTLPDRRPYSSTAALSPDGDRIAVSIRSSLDDSDLFVYGIAARQWTQLTSTPHEDDSPVWSPDGRWIVFTSFRTGHGNLFRVPADGSGPPEQLTTGLEWDYAGGVSPDGDTLVFMRQTGPALWDLMTLRLEPDGVPEPFLAAPGLEVWPAFSPDGRWVAYESDETGGRAVHIRPYHGPGRRATASGRSGWRPFWRPDGRELFYRSRHPHTSAFGLWSVPVQNGIANHAEARELFDFEWLGDEGGVWLNQPSISPDGERFLVIRHPKRERLEHLVVYVPNLAQELTRAGVARR